MEYIRLENFRCFDDTGKITLTPLMFLVGANSTGKSSFLKQFPLIKQSVRHRRNGVFLWNSPSGIDLDNFNNTLKDGEEKMVIEYGISNINIIGQRPSSRRKVKRIPNVEVAIELRKVNDRFEYLSHLDISFYDQKIELEFDKKDIVKNLKINGVKLNHADETIIAGSTNSLLPRLIYVQDGHVDDETSNECRRIIRELNSFLQSETDSKYGHPLMHYISIFSDARVESRNKVQKWLSSYFEDPKKEYSLNELFIWYNLNRILDSLNYYFLDLADNITYVQPIRATAERYYRIDNIYTDEINSDGTNLAMFLYNLPKTRLIAFQKWTKRMFDFKVKLKPSEGHVQLQIETPKSRDIRNITDVGFGYSQILPILAIIWKALMDFDFSDINKIKTGATDPTRIIVIEQPELHLHPRFISMFASMLAKIIMDIKKRDKRLSIIIETHSEALINAIGEEIANKKTFEKNDVKIILFNASSEFHSEEAQTSYIKEASYDSEGYLIDWPYGFFSNR